MHYSRQERSPEKPHWYQHRDGSWCAGIGALARGRCGRVTARLSERSSRCAATAAATAAAMQPGRGSQWTIKLPSSDYLLPTANGARHGKGPKGGGVGEPPQWTALHGYVQLMCRDKRTGPGQPPPLQQQQQQQQLQQHRNKPRMAPCISSPAVSALTDVVTASAYYAAAASPAVTNAAATAIYWQQLQQQPLLEDAYAPYRGTATDAFVFQQQVSSFMPWREVRPKNGCLAFRQAMCADGDGLYAPSDDTGFVAPQELQSFYPFQNQEPPQQQEHEWAQQSYLPYDDDALGASGQGDGDAPAFGGGAVGGAPEDYDVMLEEQDEVVAMLVEVDKRHEKHLAFERVLQERGGCFHRNRWRTQLPQLKIQQQRIISNAGSSESVDVCVEAALWRSVSDSSLHDTVRGERWFRCPSTKIEIQAAPEGCSSVRVATDQDKVTATVCVADSPPRTTTPSPTEAVADAAPSTTSSKSCIEPTEKAATNVQEAKDKDSNRGPVEPKDGNDARSEERTRSSESLRSSQCPRPLSSRNPVNESTSVPAARCRPVQPQEPANAGTTQQRKVQDFKRPAHARREYHSTRRYNEPEQAMPPLMGKAPGAGRQLKTDTPLPQKGHCNEPVGNNRRISPSEDVYARGQQQPPRGGGHSSSRNRNRSNRQSNGHSQWNKDRARPDNADSGNRGGGATAHRNSASYCCHKVNGASRSPADAHVPTPPPAPPPRGRNYNNKQNAGGGPTQIRKQFSNTRPGPQPGTTPAAASATPREATSCNTNRSPAHRNKTPVSGDTPCPSRRSRRQQHQQKQRPDYNQPRNSRVNALAADTSPRHGSRDGLPSVRGGGIDASPDGTDGDLLDDASRRRTMSLKGLWERTNLTIFRRRPSQ